jgi:L-ascorbate metabolism protein UlaG (beta-lactamase superfamily)
MFRSGIAVIGALLSLGLVLLGTPDVSFAGSQPSHLAVAASSSSGPADAALLAEGTEGDVDESFNSHGADTDEEMEMDTAKMPQDTTKKAAQPGSAAQRPSEAQLAALTKGIRWLGQSAVLIQDSKTIYIDPFELNDGLPPADLILVTHDHFDHLSLADIAKISNASTVIVTVKAAREKLPKAADVRIVKPGDTLTVAGVRIEAVPAYNIARQFHLKKVGYVGFIVRLPDRSIYHAGDTEFIPEMKTFKADVAFLPVGGTYTMDPNEAAKAADAINPKVAIPMHYGGIVGTPEDALAFKAATKVPVVILKSEAKQAPGGRQSK